jgi:hypothetical protein
MKALFYLFIFCSSIIMNNSKAQKFSSDKTSCLNSITQKGYKYAQQKDNPSVYWYMQYDQYGECLVQLTFDGNILRKIVIGHRDKASLLNRFKELYKYVSSSEALTFDWTPSGNGYGKAYNTNYYNGNARYECDTQNYFFVILPIN